MNSAFNQSIRIGRHVVSSDTPAFIIAEIGSNHNQSLQLAKKLIDVAAKSGAQAVKFQSLKFTEQYLPSHASRALRQLHKKIDFSEHKLRELHSYAVKKKLLFISSPTYFDSVDFLEKLKVQVHKVASPITVGFTQLIKKIAKTQKPILLSIGYCSEGELKRAVDAVREVHNKNMIMLYCTSSYPTDPADIDFKFMQRLQRTFGCLIGFSDHTMSTSLSAVAVTHGARVIEKHLTLSRDLPGPDHAFALEPAEFENLVGNIRDAESAMGPHTVSWRSLLPMEKKNKQMMIMKLVVARDMKRGSTLRKKDIIFRRAPGGIPEAYLEEIVGKKIRRSLKALTLIKRNDLMRI